MSVAAAIFAILGTSATYLSGSIGDDAKSCQLKGELVRVNGSPELHSYRNLTPSITQAQAYFALAMTTRSQEQRREYAYLGLAAANNAIVATPEPRGSKMTLLSYPTEEQLADPIFMQALANKIYSMDVTQLVPTLRAHDEHMSTELSEIANCTSEGATADTVGAIGILLTLLSVALIAFREFNKLNTAIPD